VIINKTCVISFIEVDFNILTIVQTNFSPSCI